MIENDLIQELDYDKIPNAKENIGAEYYEQAAAYDPGNKYCVPYCWGTVGIIYNKTLVDTPPTKWADLWDEKYSDEILMMDSIKDCFMVALKKNGFSSNSLDESELQIATEDLIAQKPLVQAYVCLLYTSMPVSIAADHSVGFTLFCLSIFHHIFIRCHLPGIYQGCEITFFVCQFHRDICQKSFAYLSCLLPVDRHLFCSREECLYQHFTSLLMRS